MFITRSAGGGDLDPKSTPFGAPLASGFSPLIESQSPRRFPFASAINLRRRLRRRFRFGGKRIFNGSTYNSFRYSRERITAGRSGHRYPMRVFIRSRGTLYTRTRAHTVVANKRPGFYWQSFRENCRSPCRVQTSSPRRFSSPGPLSGRKVHYR